MERGTINKEYAKYQGTPQQKKNRAARNRARSMVAKAKGTTPKKMNGDVAHKHALSKGGENTLMNLFVESKGLNRSFARGSKGNLKSEVSKKEKKRGLKRG